MEFPVSESLKARLAGKVRGIPVGAGKLHGIGDGESASKSAHLRQSADQGGTNQPMGKTRLRKTAGRWTKNRAAFLSVVQ